MPTFKRRVPEIIDARQFTGGVQNGSDLALWINSNRGNAGWYGAKPNREESVRIATDAYSTRIYVGDWVILRQDGTVDYARPQDFEADYVQV